MDTIFCPFMIKANTFWKYRHRPAGVSNPNKSTSISMAKQTCAVSERMWISYSKDSASRDRRSIRHRSQSKVLRWNFVRTMTMMCDKLLRMQMAYSPSHRSFLDNTRSKWIVTSELVWMRRIQSFEFTKIDCLLQLVFWKVWAQCHCDRRQYGIAKRRICRIGLWCSR